MMSMRRLSLSCLMIATLLVAGLAPSAGAEPPCLDWIKQKLVPLRTIEPADEDFADMAPLKEAIGEATVVALGEQNYGDGRTYLAKTRLIKFLHREMGFDVLVWEAGFYDCTLTDAGLAKADVPLDAAAAAGLFTAWAAAKQVVPLLEYARASHATPCPLTFAGMDIQLSGEKTSESLPADLRAVVERVSADAVSAEDWQALANALPAIKQRSYRPAEHSEGALKAVAKMEAVLADSAAAEQSGLTESELKRWRQTAVSLRRLLALSDIRFGARTGDSTRNITNARDFAMAENVLWLKEHGFPGRKIIIWGASTHLLRGMIYQQPVGQDKIVGIIPTGDLLHSQLKRDLYTIAFVATEGKRGDIVSKRVTELTPPEGDSLDAALAAAGPDQFFLDLRSASDDIEACISSAQIGGMRNYQRIQAPWPHVCDAVLFIRRQEPAARIDAAPAAEQGESRVQP